MAVARALAVVFLSLGCLAAADAAHGAISPTESVVNLLVKLKAQTIAEGKAEAVAYDKFACFCKEQADDKLYSITKANKKIALLTAEIEELTADITKLNQDIAKTNKEIQSLEKTNKEEQAQRDADFQQYVAR